MTISPSLPASNALLAAVCSDTLGRLLPQLELVRLERGEILHEMCGPIRHAHFPSTALISAFVDTTGGASAEVALIGAEGGLGLMAALSGMRGNFRAVVDTPGEAYRLRLEALRDVLRSDAAAQITFMRYLTARTVQIAINAVCNAHHSLQQRLCRALLMRLDRSGGGAMHMTQALMADILGARRTGITKLASELRRAGAIEYFRGSLSVIDREVLKRHACGCDHMIKDRTPVFMTSGDAP